MTTPADLSCIEELAVPKYSGAARGVLGGTVVATVKVGEAGRARSVKFHSPNQALLTGLYEDLIDRTTYSPQCSGRTVEIVFTLRLEGEEAEEAETIVRFKPPNHFIFISRPAMPNFYYRRPDEK